MQIRKTENQFVIQESKYHSLERVEKNGSQKYFILNKKMRIKKYEITFGYDYIAYSEKNIIEKALPVMNDLDRNFEVLTKSYVNYPFRQYTKQLLYIFKNLLVDNGFKIRKNQIIISRQMFNSMMQGHISLCEAEVGTGKTHAYLLSSVLYKKYNTIESTLKNYEEEYYNTISVEQKPVIISTSNITLQEALLSNYIPILSKLLQENKILANPLSAVVRKGKEHYICDKRLAAAYNESKIDKELLNYLTERNYTDIDLSKIKIDKHLKDSISVPKESCSTKCILARNCRFRKLLSYLKGNHDYQICNHNYFLADIKAKARNLPPLIPSCSAIIIDEAHKLEEVARTIYGDEIAQSEIIEITDIAKKYLSGNYDISNITNTINQIININNKLFLNLKKNIIIGVNCRDEEEIERFQTNITGDMVKSIKYIRSSLKFLYENIELKQTIKNSKKDVTQEILNKMSLIIEKLSNLSYRLENLIYWLEDIDTDEIKLCFIPRNLNSLLNEDLFSNGIPIVLTSGTISMDGNFSYLKNRLGLKNIKDVHAISVKSPFDFAKNCLIHIPENIPFPDSSNPKYINAIIQKIIEVIQATNGRTLILFTSYKVLDTVYKKLIHLKQVYTLINGTKSDITLVDRYKASKNPVLFATGSCWEGIDIPGDILSSLIIVKLPFPVEDPILKYERTKYDTEEEYNNSVLFPEMIIKLRQGFGRLVRKEDDTGVVTILDSRVNAAGKYREKVLKCLPECNVVNSVSEISSFLKKCKGKDYFSDCVNI